MAVLTGGFTILKQNSLVKLAGIHRRGGTASHGQVNAKDSGVLLGKVLPTPPTPPPQLCGVGQDPRWRPPAAGRSRAAQPPRETPSVLRRSQCLQKCSFVQGQPLCVLTGPRWCPAGDGTQDRWPLRSAPLGTLTPFQKCSRSVT